MRFPTVAVCTIAALSTWDAQAAIVAAEVPSSSPPADVMVSTATELSVPVAIASPESVVSQEFSNSSALPPPTLTSQAAEVTVEVDEKGDRSAQEGQTRTAQYYQDYQAPVTEMAPPTLPAAAPPASPPIDQPEWVVPQNAPTVTVQAPKTPPPNSPPPLSSDLVVTATDVQIVGANAELEQVIRGQIRTQPGRDTSNTQLQRDVATLLDTGLFASANVNSRINSNGLSVTFQVSPIVVRSLNLVGAQALSPSLANEFLKPQLGAIVSPIALNESAKRINEWYAKNGFNLARVVAVSPSRDGTVTIEVAEGKIGAISVQFTDEQGKTVNEKGEPIRGRTQESFIKQQVQTRPGQVFQESVAQQDLQKLVQTGLFSNARVDLKGDARKVDVIYVLTEARSRAANLSGGYNDDLGVYGSVNYSDRNIGGVGQRISGNVLVGTKDVQFDGRFISPYRASEPDKLGYSANFSRRRGISRVFDDDESELVNGDRVREGRFGGGAEVNRPLGNNWNGSLGLNYTRVSLRDEDGNLAKRDRDGSPLSFSGRGIDDLVTIGFNATRDLRDNSINPTQGSLLTLSTEQSIPIGLGNIFSNRLQANYTEYVPVNFLNSIQTKKQPEVLAFNLQAGTTIGDLPPYNAFTLGGPNSVRGYGGSEVGIGRSYVLASAEYRFPVVGILGGALFADFASDLGSAKGVLGEPGVDRNRPGAGFGVGAGLRLNSPLGIIRADFGVNDQGATRLQFGVGQKF
ncbi:MAG: BamA/TamA family outer membrane protein [Leptolyngbyaceae cyanobacterium CSU_1_3]|nr:BamA/TamA family outer membrane protein [Leptolyngbyaceae cyanobacterium CSU_1_3]